MKSLHIELTNRCILACPACPRTQWQELLHRPLAKADLDIDILEEFLDCPGGRQIESFLLCGDYGDCIYYPSLLDFIQRFRSRSMHIVTNGGRRTAEFWHQLADLMRPGDQITFSIDGLEDTNHLYRRNSDWSSTMLGLEIMIQSPATVHWKTIVFAFNHDRLDEIRDYAENKGAVFTAEKTHRYGDESLRPLDQFVEQNHVYHDNLNSESFLIDPGCADEKVVTCDGYFFPCDWIRNPRTLYKSQLWKQRSRWIDRLDLRKVNYDEGMAVILDWANFVRQNSIDQSPLVDVLCKMKCRQGCRDNKYVSFQ